MYELVRVGADQLIGEIIRLEGDNATIQVQIGSMLSSWGLCNIIAGCGTPKLVQAGRHVDEQPCARPLAGV